MSYKNLELNPIAFFGYLLAGGSGLMFLLFVGIMNGIVYYDTRLMGWRAMHDEKPLRLVTRLTVIFNYLGLFVLFFLILTFSSSWWCVLSVPLSIFCLNVICYVKGEIMPLWVREWEWFLFFLLILVPLYVLFGVVMWLWVAFLFWLARRIE